MDEPRETFNFEKVQKIDWVIFLIAIILGASLSVLSIIRANPIFFVLGISTLILGLVHLAWASKTKKEIMGHKSRMPLGVAPAMLPADVIQTWKKKEIKQRQSFKYIIAIAITALLIGILIGHYMWTDSDVIKPLSEEQVDRRIEFMDMIRGHLLDIMRQYDEAVEWNRRAREEGERQKIKTGGKK